MLNNPGFQDMMGGGRGVGIDSGGFPGLPWVGLGSGVDQRTQDNCKEDVGKKCGPDVTKWFVWLLMKHLMLESTPFDSGVRFLFLSMPYGYADVKNRKASIPDACPIKCPKTIMLCGKCISDQIPGNIAFSFTRTVNLVTARLIGAVDARVHGDIDSDEDVRSYEIGERIEKWLRGNRHMVHAGRYSGITWRYPSRSDLEKELCKEIFLAIDEGVVETSKCTPCDSSWKP